MKIAVIFSTQLRTIEYTTPNLLKFFGELFPQIDFFCHTWDISYHSTKQSGIIRHDNPNETIIEDYNKLINNPKIVANFIKIFNPKKMVIENFLEYQKKNYLLNENDFQMWYSIWAGNELKKQYEIENDFKYDIVIKVRGDLIFQTERTLLDDIIDYKNENNKNTILYIEDFYYLSNSESIDLLSEYGNPEKFIYKNYNNLPWGHIDYLKSIKLNRISSKVCGGLFRNEAIGLNIEQELNEIFNIYKNYYN